VNVDTVEDFVKQSRWLAVAVALSLVLVMPVPAQACGSGCNQAPFASFDAYQSTFSQWSFNASSSSDVDGTIVSYYWNFGDGTSATTTNPYAAHNYGPGEYYVSLTVTDDDGACNSTTRYIKTCGGAGQGECPDI